MPTRVRAPAPCAPEQRSLLSLYLLGVATAGVALCFWAARTARTAGRDEVVRRNAVAAGLACAAPVLQIPILYDLARASYERRGMARHASGALVAPGLVVGIALLVSLGAWRALWLPALILAPVPFVWVQALVNREPGAARVPLPRWQYGGASGLAFVGALGLAALGWKVDGPVFGQLLAGSFDGGDVVTAPSGLFELELPDGVWHRLEPGTLGDSEAEFEFSALSGNGWIIAYVHGKRTLDAVVDERRALIRGESRLEDLHETRSFSSGTDLVPVSVASYSPEPHPLLVQRYVIYTARLEDRVIEVIAYSAGNRAEREAIDRIGENVRLTGESGKSP